MKQALTLKLMVLQQLLGRASVQKYLTLVEVLGRTMTYRANADTTLDGTTMAIGDVWLDSNDGHRLYVMTNVTSSSEAATPYAVNEAITDTSNFIRNRLTTLTVNGTNTNGF